MNQIEKLWAKLKAAKFPRDAAGVEIDGIDLVEVDTFTAGCISSFLHDSGRLDPEKIRILKECVSEIALIHPKMKAETAKYFYRLHEIAQLILNELHVH